MIQRAAAFATAAGREHEPEKLLVTPPSLSDPLTCSPLGCSLAFSPHFISLLAPQQSFHQISVLTTVDLCRQSSKLGAFSKLALRFG